MVQNAQEIKACTSAQRILSVLAFNSLNVYILLFLKHLSLREVRQG